jgi:hypothetical protein
MILIQEFISLVLLAFNAILFFDFLIIEFVLKLNVFAYGKAWLRLILIGSLLGGTIIAYLLINETDLVKQLILVVLIGVVYLVWDPLYFQMLIEQNEYWMHSVVKKRFYILLVSYTIFDVIMFIILVLTGVGAAPPIYLKYGYIMDLVHLIVLSLSEIFILYNIFKEARVKVKPVSLKLWEKVFFCLMVCIVCIISDFVMVGIENLGYGLYAYELKSVIFSFKVVFECLCFQFIKGIILSIEQ